MAKSNLEQALEQFPIEETSPGTWEIYEGVRPLKFEVWAEKLVMVCGASGRIDDPSLYSGVDLQSPVGRICRFVSDAIEQTRRGGDAPPRKLKGTGDGGFEELLMTEAGRLEAQGFLTMGRYPVASVTIKGSAHPIQVPSLPDFEGVFNDGRQFVIEAKVCSESAFKIDKAHLKPRQVKHMLTRHQFGVPGFLLIHFNEREGKTFYDPPLTVGIHIRPERDGGHPVWEKFVADKKGAYAGSLDRAEVRSLGTVMEWHTPKQCRSPRPNLVKFLLSHRGIPSKTYE
jgi:hypothetical protein